MPTPAAAPALTLWALSDVHYGKIEVEAAAHLAALHREVPLLRVAHQPDAVLLVGDVVDTVDPAAYAFARADLRALFPGLARYPAVGNHEYAGAATPSAAQAAFCAAWQLPSPCYRRELAGTPLLVLDMVLDADGRCAVPAETVAWLEAELATIGDRLAIIAEHCPLAQTVGDRNPGQVFDYSTTNPGQPTFRLANSAAVRAACTRHPGPRLFLSGHTHSGWEAPNLVKTEWCGGAPVTFVNLMSPHFTGIHGGHNRPDVVMLWHLTITPHTVRLTAHDLLGRTVAHAWDIPLRHTDA